MTHRNFQVLNIPYVKKNMMTPLLEGGKGVPKIPKAEVKLIFANIEALNAMHKEFLSKLEALMTQESPLFGPLFEEYVRITFLFPILNFPFNNIFKYV